MVTFYVILLGVMYRNYRSFFTHKKYLISTEKYVLCIEIMKHNKQTYEPHQPPKELQDCQYS